MPRRSWSREIRQIDMSFKEAERRFRQLQSLRDRGELDPDQFRVQVATLLLRDTRGAFWMIDANTGNWFRNVGDGWHEGDPHADFEAGPGHHPQTGTRAWSRRRRLVLVTILLLLLTAAAAFLLVVWPAPLGSAPGPSPTSGPRVEVRIASPAEGAVIALDQQVGIESMLLAPGGLETVAHVELQVDGQTTEARPVASLVQSGQTALPVSLPWRPAAVGDHQVTVRALSATGAPLGQATVNLRVSETSAEILPEPACTPDATFLADVTIPPGANFLPGALMDKVWQVRNSGTCAWDVGYELAHVGGEGLGAPASIAVPPTAAGERSNLEVALWAPEQAGVYTSTWQLRSPQGVFFGPTLPLSVHVEIQAQAVQSPSPPANLRAQIAQDGQAVHLTWEDRSENEDAFRVYRQDVEASIGLVPADSHLFVDRTVACGKTYRYGVTAFNAAGSSSLVESSPVSLPSCTAGDAPPTLMLSATPTQIAAGDIFTITFQAQDDVALSRVIVRGERTGLAELDMGRAFPCSQATCTAIWSLGWQDNVSTTLNLVAVATDTAGQASDPARTSVLVRPPD
jgi:hypothetical protein